jgi:phosphomevalonate kinase
VSDGRTTLKGAPVVLAPGKLFLCGEYAVLEGGVAVLTAVSRWAVAQFLPEAQADTPLVNEAVTRARDALGDVAAALPGGSALVDTDAFSERGVKLGLGSSAAAAVASVGAVLEYAGVSLATNKELLFGVADAAHRAAQAGVGSGADVGVSVYGGYVRFVRFPGGAPVVSRVLPPQSLVVVPFWTRSSARTVDFLAGMYRFETRAGAAHARHMSALRAGANRFAEAFASGDARGVVREADGYGQAMGELGKDAGLPIVTPAMEQAEWLARTLGGAVKPSGAGGGDVGLAFFSDVAASKAFVARCPEEVLVLDIRLGATGAYRRLPSGIESFKKD